MEARKVLVRVQEGDYVSTTEIWEFETGAILVEGLDFDWVFGSRSEFEPCGNGTVVGFTETDEVREFEPEKVALVALRDANMFDRNVPKSIIQLF